MKKRNKIIFGFIIAAVVIAATAALYVRKNNKNKVPQSKVEIGKIYTEEKQAELLKAVQDKKAEKKYTFKDPLVLIDPFMTNSTGVYIYFNSEEESMLEYTVHINDDKVSDFTRTLYNEGKDNLTKEHEYSLIGLIAGRKNTVKLTLYDKNKKVIGTKKLNIYVPPYTGAPDVILKKENGDSKQALSYGLFMAVGSSGHTQSYLYDNNGILRAELTFDSYRMDRPLIKDNLLYTSAATNKIAAVNRLGYPEKIYSVGDYEFHHDYAFGKDNSIVALVSDKTKTSEEDKVIKLDLETGKVTELIDFTKLLSEYYSTATLPKDKTILDWLHLNSIYFVNDNDIVVSSRETSTVIKVNDIYNKPYIDYMIGHEGFWKGTPYSNLLLKQVGEFTINGGQHDVEVIYDKSLKDGQYYLDMFNNNHGISTTNKSFDWSTVSGIDDGNSKYYRYLVDENERTFKLVHELDVTESNFVGNVQRFDNHLVVNSGNAKTFAEYDGNDKLISKFKMDRDLWGVYRCFKVSGDNFVFYNQGK